MIEKYYINNPRSKFLYWETQITKCDSENLDADFKDALCLVKHSDYEKLEKQLKESLEVINIISKSTHEVGFYIEPTDDARTAREFLAKLEY